MDGQGRFVPLFGLVVPRLCPAEYQLFYDSGHVGGLLLPLRRRRGQLPPGIRSGRRRIDRSFRFGSGLCGLFRLVCRRCLRNPVFLRQPQLRRFTLPLEGGQHRAVHRIEDGPLLEEAHLRFGGVDVHIHQVGLYGEEQHAGGVAPGEQAVAVGLFQCRLQ